MKRDSHAMTEANWARLDAVAKQVGCISWRVMLRRIAAGELCVAPIVSTAMNFPIANYAPALERVADQISEPEQVTLKRYHEAAKAKASADQPLASRRAAREPIKGGLVK